MKAVHLFLNVDLRMGHEGLAVYAHQKKVNIKTLEAGSAVIFINTRKDKMKAYSPNGVVSYLRMPGNRPIDLAAMDYIPQAFDPDGKLDYSKALKARLNEIFKKKEAINGKNDNH